MMDVQPSSSKKRKRTCTTSTPKAGIVQRSSEERQISSSNPSNALEVEGVDPNGTSTVRVEGILQSNQHTPGVEGILQSDQHTPEVDPFVDEDDHAEGYGDDWEDEDMETRAGCVEGQIEPKMVETFIHPEEKRQFRSRICVAAKSWPD